MAPKDKDIDDLTRLIRDSPKGPQGFSKLVATWNDVFRGDRGARKSPEIDTALEAASLDAIAGFDAATPEAAPPDIDRLLGSFPMPVILGDRDGCVLAANAPAFGLAGITIGAGIERLGIALEQAEPVKTAIGAALAETPAAPMVMRQGYLPDNDTPVTLAFMSVRPETSNAPLVLIFVIDLVWRKEAGQLLASSAELTTAETEILDAFVAGQDLADIAKTRGRSYATVRTQFQTILRKTGADSKTALLRKALAFSGFVDAIGETTQAARHPFRKSAGLLRPGGRRIDVTLAGDFSGETVIFLPHTTQKTFPPRMEAAFAKAGLCMVSICRPGTGNTDPAPEGTDIDICMAEDVAAVQSQLGATSSTLYCTSSGIAFAFRCAQLLGPAAKRLLVVSGFPPGPFITAHRDGAPYASALVRAANTSPTVLSLLVRSGITAWKMLGTRRFMTMQLAANPEDVALAVQPDWLAEFEAGFQSTLARGTEAGTFELKVATVDWSAWVRDCPCPMTWLHGTKDAAANIESVRRFLDDFPEIDLHEIEGAGWMLQDSHLDVVMSHLTASP